MSLFGWCMTGQHEGCRVAYVDWNKTEQLCSCECHPAKPENDNVEL